MEEGGAVSKCRFGWQISEPFVPWRSSEAIFYHGSGTPFLTEWKVVLDPYFLSESNAVSIRVRIECLQPEGSEEIIKVCRIKGELFLEPLVTGGRAPFEYFTGYDFIAEYQHSVERMVRVQYSPNSTIIQLKFNIEMDFPNEPPEENDLVFRRCDLKELSGDLGQLRISGRYTDLILKAKDSDQAFPVHSFMLRARWNNFFTEHPEEDVVQTGISKRILTRILKYIYQGRGRQIPRVDELFKVIDRYRLHHLYKTFISEDSQQERRTYQKGRKFWHPYFLDYATRATNFEWITAENDPEYDFRMNISFHLTRDHPQFTYTLESRSPLRLFAQLTLEMMQMRIVTPRTNKIRQFHRQDFVFEPNETKNLPGDGNRFDFEGDRSVVFDYINSLDTEAEERRFQYSFSCILTLSTGTQTLQLGATGRKSSFQKDKKMYDVLSTHMSELMNQEDDHDFQVVCPGENATNGRETHRLHKAIFAARVPKYWAVLEGVEEESEIPDEAECTLSSEAFRYVRQYIYTGKVDPIPDRLRVEIANFACRGEIHCLNTLALKMINEGQRR